MCIRTYLRTHQCNLSVDTNEYINGLNITSDVHVKEKMGKCMHPILPDDCFHRNLVI